MNDDIDDLGQKISDAKQKPENAYDRAASNKSDGMKTASEFLSYAIAGVILGFMADKYIGTAPWGIIVLPVLGLVMGVYRANEAQKQASNKKP